jgi:hypothetical protein
METWQRNLAFFFLLRPLFQQHCNVELETYAYVAGRRRRRRRRRRRNPKP